MNIHLISVTSSEADFDLPGSFCDTLVYKNRIKVVCKIVYSAAGKIVALAKWDLALSFVVLLRIAGGNGFRHCPKYYCPISEMLSSDFLSYYNY